MTTAKKTSRTCFATNAGYYVSYPSHSSKQVESRMCGNYRYHCIHDSSSENSHLHWPKHYLNQTKVKKA